MKCLIWTQAVTSEWTLEINGFGKRRELCSLKVLLKKPCRNDCKGAVSIKRGTLIRMDTTEIVLRNGQQIQLWVNTHIRNSTTHGTAGVFPYCNKPHNMKAKVSLCWKIINSTWFNISCHLGRQQEPDIILTIAKGHFTCYICATLNHPVTPVSTILIKHVGRVIDTHMCLPSTSCGRDCNYEMAQLLQHVAIIALPCHNFPTFTLSTLQLWPVLWFHHLELGLCHQLLKNKDWERNMVSSNDTRTCW